jgi:CBS domain-containing protein
MDLKPNSQMPLSTVLAGKGRGTSTLSVAPDLTVAAAAAVLIQNQVGSVLVMDGGRLVGIFTERDILRRVVGERRDPATTRVADVMTRDLVVMRPSSSVMDAMRVIAEKRIRHIPVVDQGKLIGIVSIGDVVKAQLEQYAGEVDNLQTQITQG